SWKSCTVLTSHPSPSVVPGGCLGPDADDIRKAEGRRTSFALPTFSYSAREAARTHKCVRPGEPGEAAPPPPCGRCADEMAPAAPPDGGGAAGASPFFFCGAGRPGEGRRAGRGLGTGAAARGQGAPEKGRPGAEGLFQVRQDEEDDQAEDHQAPHEADIDVPGADPHRRLINRNHVVPSFRRFLPDAVPRRAGPPFSFAEQGTENPSPTPVVGDPDASENRIRVHG